MANIVVVLDTSGRVARVEKRDATLLRTGKVLFDSLADARSLGRGRVDADRSVVKRQIDFTTRKKYADEIRENPTFTTEQKEEWYALLSGRVFALDYHTVEVTGDELAAPPGPDPAQGGESVLQPNFWDP